MPFVPEMREGKTRWSELGLCMPQPVAHTEAWAAVSFLTEGQWLWGRYCFKGSGSRVRLLSLSMVFTPVIGFARLLLLAGALQGKLYSALSSLSKWGQGATLSQKNSNMSPEAQTQRAKGMTNHQWPQAYVCKEPGCLSWREAASGDSSGKWVQCLSHSCWLHSWILQWIVVHPWNPAPRRLELIDGCEFNASLHLHCITSRLQRSPGLRKQKWFLDAYSSVVQKLHGWHRQGPLLGVGAEQGWGDYCELRLESFGSEFFGLRTQMRRTPSFI